RADGLGGEQPGEARRTTEKTQSAHQRCQSSAGSNKRHARTGLAAARDEDAPWRQTGGMGRDLETTVAGLLSVGRRATGVAAELIRTRRPAVVTAKGDRDSVTDVDLAVERTIRGLLAEATPGIAFLGEEA